jgi:hypothetical protein
MSDRIPTLADLCSAIAEGHITPSVDGDMYQVSVRELRHYFRMLRSTSLAALPSIHDPAPCGTSNCTSSTSIPV